MTRLIFLFLFFHSPINAKDVVTLGTVEFPPYSRVDELTNECVGSFITITKKILAEYDIDVDVVCAPPIRVYRLLEKADVDFTINIKSTKALPDGVVFVNTPFSTLSLELYARDNAGSTKSVAAIRGFSYHGFRTKLMTQGYEFYDQPTSISAIQLFLKKRSNYLISYRAPVDYYIQEKKLSFKNDVSVSRLVEVPTYYVISSLSPHRAKLQAAFDDYAARNKITFYSQVR